MRLRNAHRVLLAAAMALGVGLAAPAPALARTEPVEGEAEAKTARAALIAARQAALERALAELPVDADPEQVKRVLARAEAWTSAYRILEQDQDGGRVRLRVEVEVDTKRLAKRVAKRVEGGPAGFRLGDLAVTSGTCATSYQADVAGELEAFGIVEQKGLHALDLALTCRDLGTVSWTQTEAAEVTIVARGPGGELARATATSFGEHAQAARGAALEQANADLARGLLDELRGGVMIWVENPRPASRVRKLVESMRRSVIGVDSARVAAIGADGAVGVRVTGSLEAKGLEAALSELEMPGFTLSGYRANGERELHVTIQ